MKEKISENAQIFFNKAKEPAAIVAIGSLLVPVVGSAVALSTGAAVIAKDKDLQKKIIEKAKPIVAESLIAFGIGVFPPLAAPALVGAVTATNPEITKEVVKKCKNLF